MDWRDAPNGMDFDSVAHRDSVISTILKLGAFYELRDVLKGEKERGDTLLRLPSSYIKEIGQYISRYEKSFDREFVSPTTDKPILEPSKETKTDTLEHWCSFWLDHLDVLKKSILAYIDNGVDFETVNRYIWSETRRLIMRAGADARLLRIAKYGDRNPRWYHKLAWWFRTRKLEWDFGKKKIIYGNYYEKFETDDVHDPTKLAPIFCGHCGSTILDNSLRPKKLSKFDPVLFNISKGSEKVLIVSTASLSHYDTPRQCTLCHEFLETAYINKVARAVMVVLL